MSPTRRLSRAEYALAIAVTANAGELAETGWRGFEQFHDPNKAWTDAERAMIRWAYWTGARAIADVAPMLNPEQTRKLDAELGADPYCQPPEMWGTRQ